MHSIRFKITAITIAAILTSILAVIGTSYLTIKAENERGSAVTMSLLSQNVQKSLDDYLDSIEQSVELAANIAYDSLDGVALVENGVAGAQAGAQTPEQEARMDAVLSEYCARLQEAFSSVAGQTQGVVTYYYCISPDISRNEHGFFYSRVGKTGFDEQEPLDARTLDPGDIEHTTWYYTAIQRGRPSWIGPYTAHFLGEMLTCSYIVPIYKSGALIGVLGMDIPFETLVEQVKSIRVYETGYACLFDERDRVLYHPTLEFGTEPDLLDSEVLQRVFGQADSSNELIRYDADGQERQMSFSTLSNGMKLVIVAPTREIIAPWVRLARVLSLVTAGIVLVFSVIILLAMGIITRPLQRLTAASKRLAAEDYDVALDYDGKDEVGTLTRAFGQMRDHVRLYVDDLNHQIYMDSLTGLPNMRYFFKLAERERQRLLDAGKRPVLLYFNLIGMKFFNRQYGFSEGDRLILDVAVILARHYGKERVSRFGQDHFAAVTDEDGLEETLRAVFEDCRSANGGRTLPVWVGIYLDSVGDVDASTACDRAKYACDMQKVAHESGFRYFDAGMLERASQNNYIVNSLDRAIAEGWIKVYYQPIVRTANGRVCDEEALARWIDPEKGLLSPAEFIPALEEAKLIYRLDLYVTEQILEKMKRQAEAGLYVVPESVNLSRSDFETCDIVEEIRRRVDAAGIAREKLTIEITESMLGSDFEMMKAQVERFQALGFKVWMDDFGSGYSSLEVLQSIHFDVIKLDMRFMQQFDHGDKSRIMLTELIRMAIGLGIETVVEGVEREDQVSFLREVGCTKMQGFYFCKAIPPEEIVERNRKGIQIGFENPDESEYYASIGRVNLYDLASVSNADSQQSYGHYFDTLPMAIMESDGESARIVRCNRSYREFMQSSFGLTHSGEWVRFAKHEEGIASAFMKVVRQCSEDRQIAFVNEETADGSTIHALVRHIATNPVTGIAACAAAVLDVSDDSDRGLTYTHIAQALSADYLHLYYVNLETEQFSEYNPDPAHAGLAIERRGENFFRQSRGDIDRLVFEADRDAVIKAFTKENVADAIDRDGAFTLTYRLLVDGEPKYVSMKAVRMSDSDKHIIIGVNNVDGQTKQREALERMREEQTTYARISALSGGFIAIYTVDPATDRYAEYSATRDYEGLGLAKEGEDFFGQSLRNSLRTLYREDLGMFQSSFTKENVMREIRESGLYVLQYRLMIAGEPRYVSARAALIEEKDGPRLIIGVSDVDAQVKREQEYARSLSSAREKANLDALTGVKNRTAYENAEEHLNAQIAEKQVLEYAVAVFDVVGLKGLYESKGHEASDRWLKRACSIICTAFKHSPVFRVGEESFIAIARGHDYEHIDELTEELARISRENALAGDAVIACGIARYRGDRSVAAVLERADIQMKQSREQFERSLQAF